MAFMIPQYLLESFATVERHDGETLSIPLEDLNPSDVLEPDGKTAKITVHPVAWWARLSAPGYMDATDWDGPFRTEQAARKFIRETYGVNDETGDDLVDD